MQTALCVSSNLLPLTPTNSFTKTTLPTPKLGGSIASRCPPIKATSTTFNSLSFNYNSQFSVFPAEACETIGGEACMADMYPEVKLKPESRNSTARASMEEAMERDYLEYNESKTVFKGEACDDLGGMFCDRDYQRGVY